MPRLCTKRGVVAASIKLSRQMQFRFRCYRNPSYLRDVGTIFHPERTAIVLNEGTIPPGRVARTAFEPVMRHEIFLSAVARGARVMRMPRLAPMHEVDRRRLSFADAAAGAVKPDQEKIGPTSRQLIAMWRREMETSFAPVASWLP